MYEVLSIDEYSMTRSVMLRNTITGTIDECFDDSALVGEKNFDFLTVGNVYNCKIKLYGDVVKEATENTVYCKIISPHIIGKKNMVHILIGNDEYYIPINKVKHMLDKEYFYFLYTRKDLIQINEVTHADYM